MSDVLQRELDALKAKGLHRSPRVIEGPQGPRVEIGGRSFICLCSNNYLNLAADPAVRRAACEAVDRFGWGAGASRLVSGTMALHAELERRLAAFKKKEAAIIFPSGYMANLGVIGSLAAPGDTVIADRLSHASIIDGCRLSGARLRIYPHGDAAALGRILARTPASGRRLVVTESLFSMDGDLAPLAEIAALARRHGAWLMVDEAHATGILGANARGGAELAGVEDEVDISMGTLSKALGSAGGYVAGTAALVEYLRNRARSFIYTTAPPPASSAAALAALRIAEGSPHLRADLLRKAARLRRGLNAAGFDTMGSAFQIIPVLVGDAGDAAALAGRLFERGILAPAIRPPTVARGTSRIRLAVMVAHSDEDIDYAIEAFRGGGP